MTTTLHLTVLAADLRGSTGLYENLGNASAASLVTRCVAALGEVVHAWGGRVFKTLGDGLMATFVSPDDACTCAEHLHSTLHRLVENDPELPLRPGAATPGSTGLRLQVALARGEVIEQGGDFFGDAVNVAARLIEHTGDDETLVTEQVRESLRPAQQSGFRSVGVWVALRQDAPDMPATHFGDLVVEDWPRAMSLELSWPVRRQAFSTVQTPVLIGRDPQCTCQVDLPTVSRSHARIDWHSGGFQLTDLSFNGTFVRFEGGNQLSLRRGTCTLVGSGQIGVGAPSLDPHAGQIAFTVRGAT
jgi:hypothetical protein